MRYVAVEKIYNLMQQVFIKLGVPKPEAKICADVLIASDLSGIESHGIGRLKMYYDRIKAGIQFVETQIEVVRDKAAIAVWDGHHGMGHVISHRAMQTAIDKAKTYGVGTVVVRNSTHYGIAGYYARQAVKQNCIGISFTNARPSIAPLFGVDPMLGTNPIAFGAPSDMEYPFLFDAATSISQRGKIEVLARAGKATPPGWAIDKEGRSYTDTKQLLVDLIAKKASMVGLGGTAEETGGHKGFGLAVMVEILSSALQTGAYLDQLHGWQDGKRVPYKLGHFFLALDVEAFTDLESFKKITGNIMRQVKTSQLFPGKEKIYVAGEKEYLNEQKICQQGIPINDNLKKNIDIMVQELDIDMDLWG